MHNIVSGLYAVFIASDVLYILYLTTLCVLKSADRVFWSCFPVEKSHVASKAVFSYDRKSCSAKDCTNVWLVIHYFDFDSVAPY